MAWGAVHSRASTYALERAVTSEQQTDLKPVLFGTFTGVFTPTLLTILGVILYVRIGWIVGNAGLGGACAIMAIGLVITACTGLSLSSIATNTRLGPGGPYAIVSRALGLEVAGAIGVPLYLTRPLGIAMYIFGFREGWLWIFPSHEPFSIAIDLFIFGLLFGIAYTSADLAFRVQFIIMAVIGASLVSIFMGAATSVPVAETTWWGSYEGFPERGFERGTDFWGVFAVFFPATTGILAGANMSGDLEDPRKAIPQGTMAAIVLSAIVYFLVAWWASRAGTMEELRTDYYLIINRSAFPAAVLAGLLGATFSSALAGLVGGPRILMAMGQHRLVPYSDWVAETSADGEPRNASLVTAGLCLACLAVRDLNAIAPLVTMFFLVTYCVINVVVLFEQGLGLVSFRPTLKVPLWVPLTGTVGSIFAMFIVNATFGLLAVVMVISVYLWIDRFTRIEEGSSDEARSSLYVALAEFAAHQVSHSNNNPRAWKPNILVPVEEPERVRGSFDLICDAALPEGSVKLLGIATDDKVEDMRLRMKSLDVSFALAGLYSTHTIVDSADYATGVSAGLQALQSAFFRPNLLLLDVPNTAVRERETQELTELALRTGVGAFLVAMHPKAGLAEKRLVTLWVRTHPGETNPQADFHERNLNLILLMGYRLMRRWDCDLRLVTVVPHQTEKAAAEHFLRELCDLARIPSRATRLVAVGTFEEVMEDLAHSDLNIMGLQRNPDFAFVRRMVRTSRSTCVFVMDSGRESALA